MTTKPTLETGKPLTAGATHGRVLVVHGHAAVGAGLQLALTQHSWEAEATAGPMPSDIRDAARRFRPDCVLIDVHLHHGDGQGVNLIAPLVSDGAQVLVLTADRRSVTLAEYLEAGAAGWIGVDAGIDQVDSALKDTLAGRPIIGRTERTELLDLLRARRQTAALTSTIFEKLTPRESLVLLALTDGLTADEIANEHFVSLATVRSQIRSVLQKLGVRTQLAAAAIASEHRGLLLPETAPEKGRRQDDPKGRRSEDLPTAHTA